MPKHRLQPGATTDASGARARRRTALVRALGILALLSVCAAGPAFGAIAVDASSSASGNATAGLTWSHAVGTGPDRLLVVGVSNSGNTRVTDVTYGGTRLTRVVQRVGGGGNVRASIWILVAPPSGTADVGVALNGPEDVAAAAVSFTGVEQGNPVGSFLAAAGTSLNASVTLAGAPGEVVVDTVAAEGDALSIAPGAGQAELWNLGTGTGGNDILGGGSTEPGAGSVTMSWGLAARRAWAICAARLRPARVVPDVMIKLASEGAGGWYYDNVYESAAATQVKTAGAPGGTAVVYDVTIQNDGNVPGSIRVTGTAGGGGFTVRYFDATGTERTSEVTGAGYVIAGLPVGGSVAWTAVVTPSGAPAPAPGGTSFNVFLTAASVAYPTSSDQVLAVTSSTSAHLTVLKSADKIGARPLEDVTYTIAVSNGSGLTSASTIVVNEQIPANTGFKVGTATFAPGTSTLTAVVSCSDGSGWGYSPVSGGCLAPAGYDYCVTQVRWTMSGSMPTGTSFGVGLTVQVR